MSTRAVINFIHDGEVIGKIYNHCDGYPEGLGVDIYKFFKEVSKLKDTRFNHAEYLAAKWIVYKSQQNREPKLRICKNLYPEQKGFIQDNLLCFLGVGILQKDPWDIEYIYDIDCDSGSDGFPNVKAYKTKLKNGVYVKGKQVKIPLKNKKGGK